MVRSPPFCLPPACSFFVRWLFSLSLRFRAAEGGRAQRHKPYSETPGGNRADPEAPGGM